MTSDPFALVSATRRKGPIFRYQSERIFRQTKVAFALGMFALITVLVPGAGFARIARNDLVVVGRVKTVDYAALDDFGLNGQMTARLTITRTLRGRPPSSQLTIQYIAHSYLPEDSELRFHLRSTKNGIWLVCREGKGRGYICG